MKTGRSVATSASLHPDTYIYKILPINTELVSISSDDALRVIDPPTLKVCGTIDRVHDGVTSLSGWGDNLALTAGRDGLVTDLSFHPSHPSTLLSGSTDGLVNIYNTTVTDEDDALTQVFNHGSSIAHTGFVSDHEVFALSHDEVFSIYDTTGPDDAEDVPACAMGDLRPHLQCDYVVDLVSSGSTGPVLGAGSHSSHHLDIVPLVHESEWTLDGANTLRLPSAHGEEVVRSFCFSRDGNTIFTAGEDGLIKAWRSSDDPTSSNKAEDMASTDKKPKKQKKSDKDERTRFKPY
ncbi:MAG: hypothetical protein Q9221_006035 [Calogaya cf. arnoldii]